MTAMAAHCRELIGESNAPDAGLPPALQPKHLAWMCRTIESCADDWSLARLHRWIGFVQCGMLANRMLDLEGAKAMFNAAKTAFGEASEDLVDHLDPNSSFEVDVGGEG
ncbi:MAG: hypothetical protein KY476_16190 [Planctomycetes bacterium]|nr:hypothetical protein [Planctomycetota bacterium]